MCYLIAKKFTEPGCISVKIEDGVAARGLVTYLGLRLLDRGVQILTVSDPSAYGEYKPYYVVGSEREFICRALEMGD